MINVICPNDGVTILGQVDDESKVAAFLSTTSCNVCGWAPTLPKNIPDVTPRQMRQALVLSGITLETIDAVLNSLPDPQKSLAKIEWEYSISFQRNRPIVAAVGQVLGWTSDQLDELWLYAGTL